MLQQHYGWRVGVPFFAAAACTAASRILIDKHWASDMTMGAFVGVVSARTVTLHLRHRRFTLALITAPGEWGVALVSLD